MAKVKIQGHASGTGVLTVTAPNTSTDRTITLPDSTGTLATTADVPAAVGGATGVDFNDNIKARFGTGNDLEIYHDGTDSYIKDSGSGDLYIQGSSEVQIESTSGENMVRCVENGTVELFHNNAKKFETTSSGFTLTGTSGTSPILELNNADTEDNDTGRETTLRFTGKRSGGEDVINAQISGHHQGNSDNDDGMILFYTNNGSGLEEAMRIDNDGRLLIGTTDSGNVNDNGLHVNADSYGFFAAKIAHRVSNGDGYGLMINIPGYTGSGGQWMARFYTSGGSMGGIKSNQNSTSYLTSSDYRLKENVDYTWDATTRLKQLKPARFNWINDSTNTLEDGFLAHEVSNIVSNAVSGAKDDTETLANVVLRANGVVDTENVNQEQWIAGKESGLYSSDTTWKASHTQDVNQTLDASKLVPLLVKTIQELEARITALEA